MLYREVEFDSPEYQAELDLRRRVLRKPLGLDFTFDQIQEERNDIHVAALEQEGNLLAVLVMTPLNSGDIKMRQVAVEPRMQGRGIGQALVRYAEDVARARGFSRMVASARETAVPFYTTLGYSTEGEPYEEVTIPHRRVVKQLAK